MQTLYITSYRAPYYELLRIFCKRKYVYHFATENIKNNKILLVAISFPAIDNSKHNKDILHSRLQMYKIFIPIPTIALFRPTTGNRCIRVNLKSPVRNICPTIDSLFNSNDPNFIAADIEF